MKVYQQKVVVKKDILTKFGIPGIPQSTICIMMLKRFIQTE